MKVRVYRVNPATGERREVSSCSVSVDVTARDRVVVSKGWPSCRCARCLWGEGVR
jgi:hypothetical protein